MPIPIIVIPDQPTTAEKATAAEAAGELEVRLGYRPIVICERASRFGPMLHVGATRAARAARAAGKGVCPRVPDWKPDEVPSEGLFFLEAPT